MKSNEYFKCYPGPDALGATGIINKIEHLKLEKNNYVKGKVLEIGGVLEPFKIPTLEAILRCSRSLYRLK